MTLSVVAATVTMGGATRLLRMHDNERVDALVQGPAHVGDIYQPDPRAVVHASLNGHAESPVSASLTRKTSQPSGSAQAIGPRPIRLVALGAALSDAPGRAGRPGA